MIYTTVTLPKTDFSFYLETGVLFPAQNDSILSMTDMSDRLQANKSFTTVEIPIKTTPCFFHSSLNEELALNKLPKTAHL